MGNGSGLNASSCQDTPDDGLNAQHGHQHGQENDEQRSAPRLSLLLRPAKLVSERGEIFCVIKDISSTGISVRLFHPMPVANSIKLELQNGHMYGLEKIWERENGAGFRFTHEVEVSDLIREAGDYPKRQLRLRLEMLVTLSSRGRKFNGLTHNLSQQGARVECNEIFAIDQLVMLEIADLQPIAAKVRWRRQGHYGLVFEYTFGLATFAAVAASLQWLD